MDTGRAPTAIPRKQDAIVKPYKLSHGTLMCGDIQKSRQFYEEFLGLEVVRHAQPAMMFRLAAGMHVVAVACRPGQALGHARSAPLGRRRGYQGRG